MIEQEQTDDTFKIFFTIAVALTAGLLVWALSMSGTRATWFTTRAAGITAYGLLTLSTIWGLLTSSRILSKWVKPPITLELHKIFSFVGLAAVAIHGSALLFDKVVPYTIWQILVPFTSSYRPASVSLGIITGYLMVILAISFYIKKQIGGPKVWRTLHYAGFLAFAMGTLHGILAGSDSGSKTMVVVYVACGGAALFLTYVRILGGRYIPTRKPREAGADLRDSFSNVA